MNGPNLKHMRRLIDFNTMYHTCFSSLWSPLKTQRGFLRLTIPLFETISRSGITINNLESETKVHSNNTKKKDLSLALMFSLTFRAFPSSSPLSQPVFPAPPGWGSDSRFQILSGSPTPHKTLVHWVLPSKFPGTGLLWDSPTKIQLFGVAPFHCSHLFIGNCLILLRWGSFHNQGCLRPPCYRITHILKAKRMLTYQDYCTKQIT